MCSGKNETLFPVLQLFQHHFPIYINKITDFIVNSVKKGRHTYTCTQSERDKKRERPVYPNPKTSSNEFLVYRKHREWRIRPVITNDITVKERFEATILLQHMQGNYLKYRKQNSLPACFPWIRNPS